MALQFREKEKVNFCDIIVTSSSSFHYTQKLNFEIKNIFGFLNSSLILRVIYFSLYKNWIIIEIMEKDEMFKITFHEYLKRV